MVKRLLYYVVSSIAKKTIRVNVIMQLYDVTNNHVKPLKIGYNSVKCLFINSIS